MQPLHVYLRAHEAGDKPRFAADWFGAAPKAEVALRSARSLAQSIRFARAAGADVRLTVVDDHSSDAFLGELLEQLEGLAPEVVHMLDSGQGASIAAAQERARDDGSPLVLFAEDDYLWSPTAILECLETHEICSQGLPGREVAIFPCDYPDNYPGTVNPIYSHLPAHLVMGSHRHWRTVTASTSTFLVTQKTLRQFWSFFDLLRSYGQPGVDENTSINWVWRFPYQQLEGAYLFAPVPTLAIHLHEGVISPFADVKAWWEAARLRERVS